MLACLFEGFEKVPIHLCGPFSIYDFKDMFTFGLGIYALTLQITKDESPDYGKVN